MREAEELRRGVVKRKEDHLGASHPSTFVSVWNLAELLEAKGSFAEAMGISVDLCCCLERF